MITQLNNSSSSRICSSLNSIPMIIWQCILLEDMFLLLKKLLTNSVILKYMSASVQFSCRVVSDSLWPDGLQHTRLPCPSSTPRVDSNSCPLSQWCHPTISSSVVTFTSCPQSFLASESFQLSQFFTSGGQSIGVPASTSVLPMNIQDWFHLGWLCGISLQSKGLSRVFSNTTVQKHQFFNAQLFSLSNSHIHTWPQEKPWPWLDGPLLAK